MKSSVVIVGGGPAGSAAAMFLKMQGIDSLIVERATFPRYHIGESTTGECGASIRALGLEEEMGRRGFPVKRAAAIFGSGGYKWDLPVAGRDKDWNLFPQFTWQVRRAEFDKLLLDTAVERGAGLVEGEAVRPLLGDDGAVLPNNVAEDKKLTVGESFTVLSTDNKTKRFVVRGIYEGSPFYPLLGSASVSQAAFDELYERPRNRFTLVNMSDGASDAAKASVESSVEGFPDTRVQTRPEWVEKEDKEIQQFLLLLYVLLALSVIISLFGMVNTLALSVFERTRELGMLRAVGMTRRQTRRMIRHESVITALIGAALGLPLGIFLAALVTRALGQYDLRFVLPWLQLLILTVVAVIAGLLAAITPARRAAKLDPLTALQYE